MINLLEKIKFLCEAKSSLQYLAKQIIVIKYGGALMKDKFLTEQIIEDIVFLHTIGIKVILVHGGGPEINSWLSKMNIPTKFCDGIRLTDYNTMEIVEMVLAGKINKTLVKLINQKNINAIGISGHDAQTIKVEPIDKTYNNFVANVKKVNPLLISTLLDQNYILVVSPVASDDKGQSYNINADNVAGALASALNAYLMIILTDTPGILSQPDNFKSRFNSICFNEIEKLIKCKTITGGMIPKVHTCMNALLNGVQTTSIIDGRVPHSLLLYLLTNEPIGSTITK
jgi:acetylglutamate kinase|uniref:Acetylglutamate kinase n=1 Tax=Thorea hispida TaxID=202687 RepID=A0A1C9CAP1_9FLOR|nr:acetylglutamate kinase [Thorea hispida]AOM65448.1 acetylglutamate kinase [Thorea hispida]ARX95817.1 acetylglutamate kinase [Thorea hispida]UNJ79107.1 acetylglutamate kinase [Thorea hispida]